MHMVFRPLRFPVSRRCMIANRMNASPFRPDNTIRRVHTTISTQPDYIKGESVSITLHSLLRTDGAFTTSTETSKEAAAEALAIARATSFCVFVDGSVRDGCIGAAAVHVREDGVRWVIPEHVAKREGRDHTSFEAELLALNKGLDLVAERLPAGQTRVTILSDCVQAIEELSLPLNKNSHPYVRQFHENYEKLRHRTSLHVCWSPGHARIAENHWADKQARLAAKGWGVEKA